VGFIGVESVAAGFLDVVLGLLLGGLLGGFFEALEVGFGVVVGWEVELGRDEFDEFVEEGGVFAN